MVIDLIGSFGWLGDEIGFVFIMFLWTCITIYLSWNLNTQNLEFETEDQDKEAGSLGFLICFGVVYSLPIIAYRFGSLKILLILVLLWNSPLFF